MLFSHMICNCCTFWQKIYYPYFMHKETLVPRVRNWSRLTRQTQGESVAPSHGLKQTHLHFGGPEIACISSFLFPSRRFTTLDIKPALIREKWLASTDLGRHSCLSWAWFHVNSCLAGHVRGAGVPWPLSSTPGCYLPLCHQHAHLWGLQCSVAEPQSSREQSYHSPNLRKSPAADSRD